MTIGSIAGTATDMKLQQVQGSVAPSVLNMQQDLVEQTMEDLTKMMASVTGVGMNFDRSV